MGRFVDDLCTIANTVFPSLMYNNQHFGPLTGIYPPELRLHAARHGLGTDIGVSMLDLSIHLSPHHSYAHLSTSLFDKRRAAEFQTFPIIRFPHITSLLSRSCVYNVIKGRFHAMMSSITNRTSFVEELAKILLELYGKGYLFPRMHNNLALCLKNHPGLYNTSPHRLHFLIYKHLSTLGTQANNMMVTNWSEHYINRMAQHLNLRR